VANFCPLVVFVAGVVADVRVVEFGSDGTTEPLVTLTHAEGDERFQWETPFCGLL